MGLTYVEGAVTGPSGASRVVRFMVDSGAKYSLLPGDDWRVIGLAPKRRMTFALADGTLIERDAAPRRGGPAALRECPIWCMGTQGIPGEGQ